MFKDFYFAFIQFQKLDHAKKAIDEFKYPNIGGVTIRDLPFNKQNSGQPIPGSFEKKLKS